MSCEVETCMASCNVSRSKQRSLHLLPGGGPPHSSNQAVRMSIICFWSSVRRCTALQAIHSRCQASSKLDIDKYCFRSCGMFRILTLHRHQGYVAFKGERPTFQRLVCAQQPLLQLVKLTNEASQAYHVGRVCLAKFQRYAYL